ncbi:MAG: cell division protein FtsK [Parcubacteria group bacterium Athens1014_10]|nr:MAG: cell division protein FtsK [Parcubacteria group bacterium Athens1014_10]TSD05880.1 MAG: cell division protein FtsK [Parcubacteria group bacterium Athens0714_12]
MPKKKEKKIKRHWHLAPEVKQEIIVVFLFAFSLIGILSIFGLAGKAGNYLADFLDLIFGYSAGIFLAILIILAFLLINSQRYSIRFLNYLGLVFFILGSTGLFSLTVKNGGYLGYYFAYPIKEIFGSLVSFIFLISLTVISLLLIFETPLSKIFFITNVLKAIFGKFANFFKSLKFKIESFKENKFLEGEREKFAVRNIEDGEFESGAEEGSFAKISDKGEQLKIFSKEKTIPKIIDLPLDLLDGRENKPVTGDIKNNKLIIQRTLENFGIPIEMGEVNIGPTVSQYTLKPSEGIKLSQITTLHNDLALALAVHPIRIEAPIPGKSLVGIEVPNQSVATVQLKELINNGEFRSGKTNLALALGKDVSGVPYVVDLKKMPHLLIAGATGSGKTVMLNAIILSLLYQNSPSDLKLILIDPKRVELTAFEGLPHLLTPTIINTEKIINALKWSIKEMEKRLDLLSEAKKKDIHSYNYNKESGEKMPHLILVIDELADLMATASQEIEGCIIRLAQMSRATGIHLIMATQRPSVNVITGLIKANITCRIAFSVASIMDSRTILDFSGAEKLLGRGDMLYISPELGKPKRLQGAFVSDKEIQRVMDYLRKQGEPEYLMEVVEKPVNDFFDNSLGGTEGDELFFRAKEEVIRAKKASASLLQRRLRVGYARAARLLDLLEEEGIIGHQDGSKAREVFVKEDYDLDNN